MDLTVNMPLATLAFAMRLTVCHLSGGRSSFDPFPKADPPISTLVS